MGGASVVGACCISAGGCCVSVGACIARNAAPIAEERPLLFPSSYNRVPRPTAFTRGHEEAGFHELLKLQGDVARMHIAHLAHTGMGDSPLRLRRHHDDSSQHVEAPKRRPKTRNEPCHCPPVPGLLRPLLHGQKRPHDTTHGRASYRCKRSIPPRHRRSTGPPASSQQAGALASLLDRSWLLSSPSVRLKTMAFDDVSYLMVRDDLLHPVAGENMLRKLDGLLPRLLADGVTDVVTCGGAQSSHTAATACCCAERGMRAHLMLRGKKPHILTCISTPSQQYLIKRPC